MYRDFVEFTHLLAQGLGDLTGGLGDLTPTIRLFCRDGV
jgi:hypothetical protein